jgi:hypothetical protein
MPSGCPAAVGAAVARRQRIKNQERERQLREYIMKEERKRETEQLKIKKGEQKNDKKYKNLIKKILIYKEKIWEFIESLKKKEDGEEEEEEDGEDKDKKDVEDKDKKDGEDKDKKDGEDKDKKEVEDKDKKDGKDENIIQDNNNTTLPNAIYSPRNSEDSLQISTKKSFIDVVTDKCGTQISITKKIQLKSIEEIDKEATEKTIARRERLNNEKTKKTIKQQNQVKNEKTKQTDCCCVS